MRYYGKEKCKILKQIRAEIAKNNDIEWVVDECKHKGNCLGTCPKCEAEVRELEKKLEERKSLGKTVAVVGVAAGIALSVTGCNLITPNAGAPAEPETTVQQTAGTETEITEGMIETETETETDTETETETETDEETYEPLEGEPAELLGDYIVIDETFDPQNVLGFMIDPPTAETGTDTDNNG